MTHYINAIGCFIVFLFLIWTFKISQKYLLHSKFEKHGYMVYGKVFFAPFYISSMTQDETLKKECRLYIISFLTFTIIAIIYGLVF